MKAPPGIVRPGKPPPFKAHPGIPPPSKANPSIAFPGKPPPGKPPPGKAPPGKAPPSKFAPGSKATPVKAPPSAFGRRLRWKQLDADGTVFGELSETAPLDPEAVDILRTVFEAPPKPKPKVEKMPGVDVPKGPKKMVGACLLDNQRAQQLAITFRRSSDNITLTSLLEGLRGLDLNVQITEEDIERLIPLWPSEAEQKLVLAHPGPSSELREMEQNVRTIAMIPRTAARLQLLGLGKSLHVYHRTVREKTAVVRAACEELLRSNRWRALLAGALRLGNHINHGDGAAELGAKGFTIDALLELRALKGSGRGTVLHALCINCAHADADFCKGLHEELQSVPKAAGDQLKTLEDTLKSISSKVVFASHELAMHRDSYLEMDEGEGVSAASGAADASEAACPQATSWPVASQQVALQPPASKALAPSHPASQQPDLEPQSSTSDVVAAHSELAPHQEDGKFPDTASMLSTRCNTPTAALSASASPDTSPPLTPRAAPSIWQDDVSCAAAARSAAQLHDCFAAEDDNSDALHQWLCGLPTIIEPSCFQSSPAVSPDRCRGAVSSDAAAETFPRLSTPCGATHIDAKPSTPRDAASRAPVEAPKTPSLRSTPVGLPVAGNATWPGFAAAIAVDAPNASCGALAPAPEAYNGTTPCATPAGVDPGNMTRAAARPRAGSLGRLEALVSRGRAMTMLAREDLDAAALVVNKCEGYFGASGQKRDGPDLFTTIVHFLAVFRTVWNEVHRDQRWAVHLPRSPGKTATTGSAGPHRP